MNYMSDVVTHLIADNDEHADVSEAIEIFEKPVVTVLFNSLVLYYVVATCCYCYFQSRWVHLSVKAKQLLP